MFQFLGCATYKYKKSVIFIWCLLFALFLLNALHLADKLGGDGFTYDGNYQYVSEVMKKDFKQSDSSVLFVVNTKRTSSSSLSLYMEKISEKLSRVDGVTAITSPLDNPKMIDGHVFYVAVDFSLSSDEVIAQKEKLEAAIPKLKGVNTKLTGGPIISDDMNKTSQSDLARAEAIGLPVALIEGSF